MKKIYESPELEVFKFKLLHCGITSSTPEENTGDENIGTLPVDPFA